VPAFYGVIPFIIPPLNSCFLESAETPSSFETSSKIVFPGDFLGLGYTNIFIFSFLLDFLGYFFF